MWVDRKNDLKSILESSEGIHLTAYLENKGDLNDLERQLQKMICEATAKLEQVLPQDQLKKFIMPLKLILEDSHLLVGMRGNVGMFRTLNSFRLISIPVKVESKCHLATTFHVKPILRWIQHDRKFILIGMNRQTVSLYSGNQFLLNKIDQVSCEDLVQVGARKKTTRRLQKIRLEQNLGLAISRWIDEKMRALSIEPDQRVFVVKNQGEFSEVLSDLKRNEVRFTEVQIPFDDRRLTEICVEIRKVLTSDVKRLFEKALLEFQFAEDLNLIRKNIFQISKAAVRGKVKKLMIADELNIHGRLDKNSGSISIHPTDLDHEDDDLLDDLAQTVLSAGGEVVVASLENMPSNRPIIAIVESGDSSLARTKVIPLKTRKEGARDEEEAAISTLK